MASSVSSECAFLQGCITISKWCSRLKGNIVEAIQCVKCAICTDLLFHEPEPCSTLEANLEITDNEEDMDEGEDLDVPETAWAWMVIDEDDLDPLMLVAVLE